MIWRRKLQDYNYWRGDWMLGLRMCVVSVSSSSWLQTDVEFYQERIEFYRGSLEHARVKEFTSSFFVDPKRGTRRWKIAS